MNPDQKEYQTTVRLTYGTLLWCFIMLSMVVILGLAGR